MENLDNPKFKGLTYKDQVIYVLISQYQFRTAKELSVLMSCNYGRLTQSLNTLLDRELIKKTVDYPPKYMTNDY